MPRVLALAPFGPYNTGGKLAGSAEGHPWSQQIVIDVPESVLVAEKTDATSFARELRMLAAVKLYDLGRLSSGRAAELAGMPRVEFLLALGAYKVFPFEHELRDLEAQHA